MEIYKECLSPCWWDGRFVKINIKCSLMYKILALEFGSKTMWQERQWFFFMDKQMRISLHSFATIENEIFTGHPFFKLVMENEPVSESDFPEASLVYETFYQDPVGYGATTGNNFYSSFSALMLPPFQNQTGYCIGGIYFRTELDENFQKKKTENYLVTPEEFCAKISWKHLVKYAKPYNAYFAAARVKQYPDKIFAVRKVVPLYIANICVGAELLDSKEKPYCREYMSFKDYMSLL